MISVVRMDGALLIDVIVDNVGVAVGKGVSASSAEGDIDIAKIGDGVGCMERIVLAMGARDGDEVCVNAGYFVRGVVGYIVSIVGAEEGEGVILNVESSDKTKNDLLKKALKLPSS